MKPFLILLFIAVNSIVLKAQTADWNTYDAMNDSLISFYNNKKFKEIYPLLNDEFKKQISENQLLILLKNNIYFQYGKVNKSVRTKAEDGEATYIWTCEKASQKVDLVLDEADLIAGLNFAPYAVAKAKSPTTNTLQTDLDRQVDSVVRSYIDTDYGVGISVGVIKDGVFYTYHYGTMDKKKPQLPNDNTFYEIGSISKTFTGTILADAVTKKKIKLDADIRQYLPEKYPNLAYQGKPILVKHLTNHTARLYSFPDDVKTQKGYNPFNPYKHYTSDMVLAYLHKVQLDTFAGFKMEYSNFATGLMGIILEKKYKMPYEALLKKFVTTPLSMNDTKIIMGPNDSARFAKPHDRSGAASSYWDLTGLAGAGAIRSTLKDMLRYAQAHMEAKTKGLQLTQQPTFQVNPSYDIGLYWQMPTNKDGQKLVWHNGMTGGFTSFCGFVKERNIAVVMLSNCSYNVTQKGFDLLKILTSK